MCPFEILQSPRFERDFKDFDRKIQIKINDLILREIQIEPKKFTLMKYEYTGLREVRLDKNLRLLFAICDECRKLRFKLSRCADCDEIEKNNIKLMTSFYHNKEKYPPISKIIK